jgi:hypothetical protein
VQVVTPMYGAQRNEIFTKIVILKKVLISNDLTVKLKRQYMWLNYKLYVVIYSHNNSSQPCSKKANEFVYTHAQGAQPG